MRNIKLTIAYDGTDFGGWQVQPNAITVQQLLENRLEEMFRQKVKLVASGRTDAGVHALGQVANFKADTKIDIEKLPIAINSHLNNDIRVFSAEEVDEEFNSRFSAKKKTYKYQIYNSRIMNPFLSRYAYQVPYKMDYSKIEDIRKILLGEHDFKAFMSSGSDVKTTVRTIYAVDYKVKGKLLEVEITGNGFLYNMIRIIIGTLVEVCSGKRDVECFRRAIETGNREELGPTAKACGLFLKEVMYSN